MLISFCERIRSCCFSFGSPTIGQRPATTQKRSDRKKIKISTYCCTYVGQKYTRSETVSEPVPLSCATFGVGRHFCRASLWFNWHPPGESVQYVSVKCACAVVYDVLSIIYISMCSRACIPDTVWNTRGAFDAQKRVCRKKKTVRMRNIQRRCSTRHLSRALAR